MDVFCKIINGEIPSKKIYEDDIIMIIMDVNPRSNGHCLIIPKNHYQDIYDIDDDVLNHIIKKAREISGLLKEKLNCDGITFEQNNGNCQEVKHFHLHVIPKYEKEIKIDIDKTFEKIIEK